MKNNNKWFSLPLSMGLVILISLLAFTILEYIIPFSKEVKWVENSSKAYYQANSWIEEGLLDVISRNNSWSIDNRMEYWDSDFSWNIDSSYTTSSSGSILPPAWEWNSEYDKNWNTISIWNPIQLSIWEWYILGDLEIVFRVPDLNWIENGDQTLSWVTTSPYTPIINWQLSSSNDTLNASWSIITNNDILSSDSFNDFDNSINLNNSSFLWVDLNWSSNNFESFYDSNCADTGSGCTLKFSVINKLELNTDNVSLPYLEWQLRIDSNRSIPLRYSKIESSGKSYGYKKDLEVKVAWRTVNEAFDFTVFQ